MARRIGRMQGCQGTFRSRARRAEQATRALPVALALALALSLAIPAGVLPTAVAAPAWEDVAAEVGVDFRTAGAVSEPGEFDWPALPEIVGAGACWFDYDNDGYEDLYLVNMAYNPDSPLVDPAWAEAADPHNQLYKNEGDGTFTDVSAASGTDSRAWGYGCSAADYDGDGRVDLYVANFGDNELFRNRGDGTFEEVGAAAGVAMPGACGEYECMSTGSAWADYDRDGDLDLYVANYVDTHTEDPGRGPSLHNAQFNFLHRNEGDGTFTEVAHQAGVQGQNTDADGSKSFGVVWFDYDLDGDLDLYVANDMTPNDFYVNLGDGTFADRSTAANLENDLAGMGVTAADYDRDGLPDLYFTHYQGQHNGFYRNNGDGTFEDRSGEDGLATDLDLVGWGTRFVDFDRDMDLDLVAVNGHTEAAAAGGQDRDGYNQTRLVYRHDPPQAGSEPWDAVWTDATNQSGDGITQRTVARGAAFADYDYDGDVDIVVGNNGNQTANVLQGSGVTNGWLLLSLAQPGMNRHAIGARVEVEAQGTVQHFEVQTGTTFISQNSLLVDVGLGALARADRVTVHWPGPGGDATTTLTAGLDAGQLLRIDRATGLAQNDTIAPRSSAAPMGTAQGGWFRSAVDVEVRAEDRGVSWASGVDFTELALDGAAWEVHDGSVLRLEAEGVHTLRMRSTDHAGNREPARTDTFRIDTTAPVPAHAAEGVPGLRGWYVSDVVLTLGGEDALSGVGTIRYRVDGGPWQDYTGPVTLSEDGVHEVAYIVADLAGNEAAQVVFEVPIDQQGPSLAPLDPRPGAVYVGAAEVADAGEGPSVVVASPPVSGDLGGAAFPVRVAAADAVSGVRQVTFQVDGRTVAVDREGPDYGFTWHLEELAAGAHELTAIASDEAGNARAATVDVLVVPATERGLAETLGLDDLPPPPDAPPLP